MCAAPPGTAHLHRPSLKERPSCSRPAAQQARLGCYSGNLQKCRAPGSKGSQIFEFSQRTQMQPHRCLVLLMTISGTTDAELSVNGAKRSDGCPLQESVAVDAAFRHLVSQPLLLQSPLQARECAIGGRA